MLLNAFNEITILLLFNFDIFEKNWFKIVQSPKNGSINSITKRNLNSCL